MLLLAATAVRAASAPPYPGLSTSSTLPAATLALAESGLALHADGKAQAAVEALQSVLDVAPSHAPTLVNLGLVWETLGLPLQAMDCYARAIDADPELAVAYTHMGTLLRDHLKEHEMAVEALQAAAELKPSRADNWARLARLLQSRGKLDDALHHLTKATTLDPT